jgi:adenosine deaminase
MNSSNINDQVLDAVLIRLISETNGLSLGDTLDLAQRSMMAQERPPIQQALGDFRKQLFDYHRDAAQIDPLLSHPVARSINRFLTGFPHAYREEHIHLTGSLSAEFIYPRLMSLLSGVHADRYEQKIRATYGDDALPINGVADVDKLTRMQGNVSFQHYLQVLTLAKLVLTDREAHRDAAYHMARTLYEDYNVGHIHLKFSLSRETSNPADALPGDATSPEDVVLGLYEGFETFRSEVPAFDYVLAPCFRKESDFYDASRFASKNEDFLHQVQLILRLIEDHPVLEDRILDVDTVGDEREHYRKGHFEAMRVGFRKLQFRGIQVRSHHGETWHTLQQGVQAVDNAMNLWHISTVEHGVSLGVNPNYYFHSIFEKVMALNQNAMAPAKGSRERNEIAAMDFHKHPSVAAKLLQGERLAPDDIQRFIKIKFHTARELEHYQHDVLNRMIDKGVSLVALPSSNIKLTTTFPTYRDHPFSWWEKKGVRLGIGTDNYVTLNTNFIRELMILLCTDVENLKITKLLMTATAETRRPVISGLLWDMRKAATATIDAQ